MRYEGVRCKVVLDEADRMIDLGFEPQVSGVFGRGQHSKVREEG